MSEPLIRMCDVGFAYGEVTALAAVDLEVYAGEIVGLVGPDGAGKSTLLRIGVGQLPSAQGSVQVLGGTPGDLRLRARIAYMPQRFGLYPDLSVLENLRFFADLHGLPAHEALPRIRVLLTRTGLAGFEARRTGQLSGGMMQKLALACALVSSPQAMFLDEPTSGVDPVARQQFWELIYDLADEGIGILVTTHYMDETAFCDRLALMHAGHIVAEGTPEQLLARPLATPMVELAGRSVRTLAPHLAGHPGVRDAIPHAGRLRVRLAAETPLIAALDELRRLINAHGLHVDSLEPARPDLEDVFVAVLEEAEAESGTATDEGKHTLNSPGIEHP